MLVVAVNIEHTFALIFTCLHNYFVFFDRESIFLHGDCSFGIVPLHLHYITL